MSTRQTAPAQVPLLDVEDGPLRAQDNPGLDAGRLIPGHSGSRLQEPEPAKKIHPRGADRGLRRPAARRSRK